MTSICMIGAVFACAEPPPPPFSRTDTLSYPDTTVLRVTDEYHGVEVDDPYRWLEDLDSPPVAQWVEAQNAVARKWFEGVGQQEQIRAKVERAIRYERWGPPQRRGDRFFYIYSDGQANQPVVYMTGDLGETGNVLLDPNQLSEDGTTALAGYEVSGDGRYFAYGVSDGGSDWRSWHVLDTKTGTRLQEVLHGIKFSNLSFTADGAHGYYSRYPDGEDGRPNGQAQVTLYRHRLGSPQAEDVPIYRIDDHPRRNPYGVVTDDGDYLIVQVMDGFDANGIYYWPLQAGLTPSGQPPIRLLDAWDARYEFLGNSGSVFYFFTDAAAPRGRVIAIDAASADEPWREVVAESEDTLVDANFIGGRFVLNYLRNAHSHVVVVPADGDGGPVVAELPGLGSVTGFNGQADDPVTYFNYEDFATRETVYRYDVQTNEIRALWSDVGAKAADIVTEQVFVESAPGVQVPVFLVRRRDVHANGRLPTLLYGYGGFNVALTPSYGAMSRAWVDSGGLFVSANLRGGGEFGKAWHRAGTKTEKQNVFDDFIAVAEWLIESGYTQPANLGISGRSNGGLLVAAALTQRPALFGAALPAVGVLDMLRYHTASANARAWSSDYGLSEDPEEFAALFAYSPYHRMREGTCYPPTLVTTADRDDRVVPWHSYKFAARLQAVQACSAPALLLVETRAGHGAGKPIAMLVDDYTAQLSFVAQALSLVVEPGADATE